MKRPKFTPSGLENALQQVETKMHQRLVEKGDGAFVSRHEVLGVCAEEWVELNIAVQFDALPPVKAELLDLAVACVLGLACIEDGNLEW